MARNALIQFYRGTTVATGLFAGEPGWNETLGILRVGINEKIVGAVLTGGVDWTGITGDIDIGSNAFTTTGTVHTGSILAGTDTSGILTLGGIGGSNNENLTFDFDTYTNEVYLSSSSGADRLIFGIMFQVLDDTDILLGGGDDVALRYNVTQAIDSLQLGLRVGNNDFSGYFSIMEKADMGHANRAPLATSADPVLRIYSFDETVATDYIEFFHDQSTATIRSGDGVISLAGDNLTTEGKIIATGGGQTGMFQTGLAGNTVFAYSGGNWDIRAGNGNNASQNVMRVDNSGNFNFYAGNLTTTGIVTTDGLILPKTSGKGIKVDTASPTFGWRDLLGDQFSKNTGGTKPTLAVYNGDVRAWQFSDGDEAFLTYHIPHDYVAGTDIHLHVHWSQNNAGATGGTIDFKYFAIYAKSHNQASGSTFTATPITDTFSSIDINDGDSGLNRYQHHFTEVVISAAIATAALFDRDDFEPDGVIELTLEMDANNLTGTPSDLFIHYVDLHYQSTNIGTKDKVPDFYT